MNDYIQRHNRMFRNQYQIKRFATNNSISTIFNYALHRYIQDMISN